MTFKKRIKIFLLVGMMMPLPILAQGEQTKSLLDIARENFRNIKQAVQEKVSGVTSDDQNQLFTNAKELALRIQEYAMNWIEGVKSRVMSSDALSQTQKDRLLASLNATGEKLNQNKQSLENATNLDEVKRSLVSMQENIRNSKNAMTAEQWETIDDSLSTVVDKAVNIYREMIQDLQKLKTAGAPTKNLEPIIENYATELEKLEFIVEDFQTAKKSGGFSEEVLQNTILDPVQNVVAELARLTNLFGTTIQNIPH